MRRFTTILSTFLLAAAKSLADDPTLILHHGKIVTVNADFQIAEALAIEGERITAVGSNAEILPSAGNATKVIDLDGKTVLPGLIDSHVHPVGAAMYEFDHPVPEMRTIDDVLRHVQSRAEALEDGQWIVLQQVFITRLDDQRYPTRAELDAAAPRNPVMFATGPDASLNSLALERSGIDKDFQINDGGPGYIERDPATSDPTGILRSCTRYVKTEPTGQEARDADRLARLKQLLADYNAVGITSISDRAADDDALGLYNKLRDDNALSCRVYCYYGIDPQAPPEKIESQLAALEQSPLHAYNNQLWVRGVKVFLDGGMLTGSAFMREPWGVSDIYSIKDPQYRGLLFINPERLEAIVRMAARHDLQFTAHSVGDGAVHALIAAYEAVGRDAPLRELRPCVTHCNFMSAEAIDKMQALGIVADLQPAWLYLDGRTLLRQFGLERLRYFQPYQTLFQHGVTVGGGSDHMQRIGGLRSVNPYNPFWGMWIALTRTSRGLTEPLYPEERLTREQAIRLYTINNAYLTFEEREKGSLEPGKLADFIVLAEDILSCPTDRIREMTVERTYLGGRLVYERK